MCWIIAACALLGMSANGADTAKPNIIVILADDLGYGDPHCYNPERGRIPTPNIDALAAQGMRFTDAHSSSGVCSPSRYALLTGRYHWRTRLQNGIVGVWGAPLIAPDRLTIAGLAKGRGYRTAAIGKWHLGRDWPIGEEKQDLFRNFPKGSVASPAHRAAWAETFAKPIPGGPTTRGFDLYFGTDVPNWPPYCFIENDRTVGIPSELLPAGLLGNHQASLPGPALPGWKLEAILPALRDRACDFIRQGVSSDKPYFLYLPLTAPHTPLAVNREWKDKSGLKNDCADLIMETDALVGRVLNEVQRTGKAEDTLVVFTSDNGFAAYVGAKDLERQGHFPSGPLRGYKTEVFEGGHRVPFIVRWPRVVKAGSVSRQLAHQADLIRTVSEILGSPLPDNAGEDSFSLLPIFRGEDKPARTHAVSCAASGVPGLRDGQWKLIFGPDPKAPKGGDFQLYNLAEDLGETRNLAADQPERVAQMRRTMEEIITSGRSAPGKPQKNDVRVRRYPAQVTKPVSVDAFDPEKPGKLLTYKESGGKPRQMEVYFPAGHDPSKDRVPGVVLFHGGAWSGGSQAQFRVACQYLASRGLVAATANYRMLSAKEASALPPGETKKRVCVTDAKSAIRWFKAHAGELGIDPRRVITGGGSAGGHIAVLATTNAGLNDPNDPKEMDTSVAAYLLFNPAFAPDDRRDPEIDALRHLKPGMAPAIVFFGDRDTWKPGWDAAMARWKEQNPSKPAELIAKGQSHGFFNRDPWRTAALIEADRFLAGLELLKGDPTLNPPATGEKFLRNQ